MIRLVGTPLGDGLFDVIVSKGTPTISSIDFYNIIMDLACNQERRIYCMLLHDDRYLQDLQEAGRLYSLRAISEICRRIL